MRTTTRFTLSVAVTAALAVGLATGGVAGAQVGPSEEVSRCMSLQATLGVDRFEEVFGSFGGCVVSLEGHASGTANVAHGCEFLVERGFFATRGECIQTIPSVP